LKAISESVDCITQVLKMNFLGKIRVSTLVELKTIGPLAFWKKKKGNKKQEKEEEEEQEKGTDFWNDS
jgi:hypothetical protein